jgi:archaellum component FlaG (FlaF/FlaG flagellin family)
VAARVDPYSLDKVSVHFTVRMTNIGSYPANFWADSFRLLVDGTLQAPSNYLNDVLPANSAKEGDVEFVIPAATSTAGLQMGDVGDGKPSIAINLANPGR